MQESIERMLILKNKRIVENEFSMSNKCSYCFNYVSQVILINRTLDISICKGCLNKMIKRLDDHMINNFQPEFERSRKEYEANLY